MGRVGEGAPPPCMAAGRRMALQKITVRGQDARPGRCRDEMTGMRREKRTCTGEEEGEDAVKTSTANRQTMHAMLQIGFTAAGGRHHIAPAICIEHLLLTWHTSQIKNSKNSSAPSPRESKHKPLPSSSSLSPSPRPPQQQRQQQQTPNTTTPTNAPTSRPQCRPLPQPLLLLQPP